VNLPNTLTTLRIFLVPLLVAVLLTRERVGLYYGTAIFAVAVLTDYLDGFLARRRNQVTRLGILLDPIADKLLIMSALIALVELKAAEAWMVLIIIGREIIVTGLRNTAAMRGVMMPASTLGKSKMVLQVLAIFLLLLGQEHRSLKLAGFIMLWAAVIAAVVSAIDYLNKFLRSVITTEKNPGSDEEETTDPG
jgi:CDP-diacylglycerol--glycerol-3-phosphate 3-phosphatidyltransferase